MSVAMTILGMNWEQLGHSHGQHKMTTATASWVTFWANGECGDDNLGTNREQLGHSHGWKTANHGKRRRATTATATWVTFWAVS